ncbi:MAG: SOS response-associated peptidase [Lentisphaerae bacterium]|nr:SOS response-associated peptidase [Lentisphaerota bacterium]
MCCRCVIPDETAILNIWPHAVPRPGASWTPGFNVAPTATVPLLIPSRNGALDLLGARWGLIPSWWEKDAPPAHTFNARVEDAAKKPAWRDSLRTRRALMPVRGWYEWRQDEWTLDASGRDVRQPFFFQAPDAPIIALAALWAVRGPPNSVAQMSCALMTRPAAPALAAIHPRMPVVLDADQQADWLNPSIPVEALLALADRSREDIRFHRVSPRVNNVRNGEPDLMKEYRPPPSTLF